MIFTVQDYCASKFAAVGFHESLAHELLAEEVDGVKTTLVCPYIVDTGMFEGCKIRSVQKAVECLAQGHSAVCVPAYPPRPTVTGNQKYSNKETE